MSADQGGPGRREVAWRVFAAEFDDADFEYSSSDEERAPNYVVTPTGARINRLFVVGVLTEVEAVSDEVLRGRIVDPTGAFVVYAGQYQPDALAFLESADVPQFVSVTGKARTFQPEDSEQVYTSIRPESINAVDAETRDRWTVQTAEHTLDRVSTFGVALDLTHSGDALREALVAGGVEAGLADGITRALEHYGTTEGYLAAVADMALDAARVVAGERDEVPPLDVAPDEETGASLDAEYSLTELDVDVTEIPEPAELEADAAEPEAGAEAATAEAEAESGDELGDFEPEADVEGAEAVDETEPAEVEDAADAAEVQPTDEVGDPEVTPEEESVPDEQFEPEPDEAELGTGEVGDEMYELDEEERREVEEEYGTEFSTGAELDQESDEAPEPEAEAEEGEAEAAEAEETGDATEAESAAGEAEAESAEVEEETEAERAEEAGEPDEPEEAEEAAGEEAEVEEAEMAEEPDDLEAVVVETMRDLDEGDGANHDELVAEVTSAYDVSADDVEDAIQDALMSGQCYEADEETLKPI